MRRSTMQYFIGALLGVNLTLIWLFGAYVGITEARVRSLEFHQVGMEAALQVGVNQLVGAADSHTMEHRLIRALAKSAMGGT